MAIDCNENDNRADLNSASVYSNNHLIPFYEGILEIEVSIKYQGYDILLRYTDIDLYVVSKIYYKYHSGYIKLINVLVGNLKLCNHLLVHSNFIAKYNNTLTMGFCMHHSLEEIINLSQKINLLDVEKYCWDGFFRRKNLDNDQSVQIIKFLIGQGLHADFIFTRTHYDDNVTPIQLSQKFNNIHQILVMSLPNSDDNTVNISELPANNLELIDDSVTTTNASELSADNLKLINSSVTSNISEPAVKKIRSEYKLSNKKTCCVIV